MKLILLQPLSGASGTKDTGDTIEVSDTQAVAFLEKGIAKCKTKKEQQEFMLKVESIKAAQLQKERELSKLLYEKELKIEKDKLETRLSEINNILGVKEVVLPQEDYEKLIEGK